VIATRFCALVLCFASAGCLSYRYERDLAFEPVVQTAVDSLTIESSDLGEALSKLGAPIYVWEGKDGSTLIAYGYQHERTFGFRVTAPLFRAANPYFDYGDAARRLRGYVLMFDRDFKLKLVRYGLLHDLGVPSRTRPSVSEEEGP
jgi:hypothetical protein